MRACARVRVYVCARARDALCRSQLQGAFASSVRYSSFWVKWPVKAFQQQPLGLLRMLRTIAANATELRRRRRALAIARADVRATTTKLHHATLISHA